MYRPSPYEGLQTLFAEGKKLSDKERLAFAYGPLLSWYREHKRALPWRENKDAYRIWISEIMLQQTRVEAVRGYYTRFLKALPTVQSLADADDELLHKLWEGLGYYSRVRNLKKAAQVIANDYSGVFPEEHASVLKLPGIGAYTAGAICSIAYDQPTPAVDGNVLRVAARLTDDNTPINLQSVKTAVGEYLKEVYPAQAGAFTQALMELGATLCGPNRKPDCASCPCRNFCLGHIRGTAEQLPVKPPKRERRIEEKTVFILTCDGAYAIEKRPNRGLLADLWQFPNVAGKRNAVAALSAVEKMGLCPKDILRQVERKHIFTHVQWDMYGFYIEVTEPAGEYTWVDSAQLQAEFALPTAFRQFIESI